MQTDKIKLIVEYADERMRSGITQNHLHVFGNIDKVDGLLDILNEDLKRYPPDSEVNNIMPIFHFMAFIKYLIKGCYDATV